MNWLKVLYRSGRQDIFRELMKEFLTPDKIADIVTDAATHMIEAGAGAITDERAAQIAVGCERGGTALIHITAAVNPNGEDGKAVSAGEKALIGADIKSAVNSLVTQDMLDEAIEKTASYIK